MSVNLARGEVLQLAVAPQELCPEESPASQRSPIACGSSSCVETACRADRNSDPTGISIESPGRLQVISGHSCAFIPFDRPACDHLEESLIPLDSWGRQAIFPRTKVLRGEPNLARITSSIDGNMLSFTPEVHPPVVLNKGEVLSFEYDQAFTLSAGGPVLGAILLVGQGPNQGEGALGDPALTFLPSSEQFRRDYRFLAPDTYDEHWLTIVLPSNGTVFLDGMPVPGATPIPGTSWSVSQISLSAGTHEATSELPFGITVQGFGSYTSYLFPGGLDLKPINDFMK